MNRPNERAVLLLDDNKSFSASLAIKLRGKDYEVTEVSTVDEALTHLRTPPPPTFILADRQLEGVKIEDDGLARLRAQSGEAHILVYTTVKDLGIEDEYKIIEAGATRVLDKEEVDELNPESKDIPRLIRELDELAALTRKLQALTTDRTTIAAAILGADVGVTVIDKHLRRWFANSTSDRFSGGACCGATCWIRQWGEQPIAPGRCWGCGVQDVVVKGNAVERQFFAQRRDSARRWVSIRSEPIHLQDDGQIIAVREALSEYPRAALDSLPVEQRLSKLAQSLIQIGFGRVRIYRASRELLTLMAAASVMDTIDAVPGEHYQKLQPSEDFRNFSYRDEYYFNLACERKKGVFVPEWHAEQHRTSSVRESVELEPPFMKVPIWGADGDLQAMVCLDFKGLEGEQYNAAVKLLASEEKLSFIQSAYGEEVRKSFADRPVDKNLARRLAIAEKARIDIGIAASVDNAMQGLQNAFSELFPGCRISVRLLLRGEIAQLQPRLSVNQPPGAPDELLLTDKDSLVAYVVKRLKPKYIYNYPDHRNKAALRGEPKGYSGDDTKSTAQIPLLVEQSVFGCLSIDSPSTINWELPGYKQPIEIIANLVALVLRDIRFESAARDRAARTASAASSSGDVVWRTWVSRLLFSAAAECVAARHEANRDELNDRLDRLLALIEDARSGPAYGGEPSCFLDNVLSQVKADNPKYPIIITDSHIRLAIPGEALRLIFQVLVQNSFDAFERTSERDEPPRGIRIESKTGENLVRVFVEDDGPGIPDQIAKEIFRGPVESERGARVSLLGARGIALKYRGDLSLEESMPGSTGAHFVLTLPRPQY